MAQFGNTTQVLNTPGQVPFLEVWSSLVSNASVQRLAYKVDTVVGGGITYGEFLTYFNTVMPPLWKPAMNGQSNFKGLGVRQILALPGTSPAPAYDNGTAGPGTSGPTALPAQVSGIITLVTAVGGRKGRGRVYVPWPSNLDSGPAGTPNVGYVASLQAIATALLSPQIIIGAGGTVGLVPVLYHRLTGLVTPLSGTTPRSKFATQRRRGDYGRVNFSPV